MKIGDVAMERCWFCGRPKGIVLATKNKAGVELENDVCYDKVPCRECEQGMKDGIMLSVVKDGSYGEENPYRLGMICVITEDAAKRIFGKSFNTNKQRFIFIEESAAKRCGIFDALIEYEERRRKELANG